jgi:hypothetical protein
VRLCNGERAVQRDAAIEGYVRDATGGAIQRARVTVSNVSTNVEMQTITNPAGYFRFPLLQVGTYGLTADADGFKQITKPDLARAAGQKMRLISRLVAMVRNRAAGRLWRMLA